MVKQQHPIHLIGLTGGIGMGKSIATGFLREMNLPVADTDIIARESVKPGSAALHEIRQQFGEGILNSDGGLNREALAAEVFANREKRKLLESILHPLIRKTWLAEVDKWVSEGQRVGIVVIPLLFETNAESFFAETICVACSGASQRDRLRARGWTDGEIDLRIAAQMPIREKMERSNYVIWSEGGLDLHRAQLNRILRGRTRNIVTAEHAEHSE